MGMQFRAQIAQGIAHHPSFFPGWPAALAMTPPLSHKSGNSPPPPTSPISPALSHKSEKSRKLNNNYSHTNNNHIVSTTTELLTNRKSSKRKHQIESIAKETDHTVPGSISPPTSSSSPQSNGSVELSCTIASSTRDPTKDKVFTCKICNRSFGYKHVLQNHERTHTGEKPFECTQCHKRFTRDHHLKTHMRLHTGEKPYSCSHCDRQFVQVANLRRHLRVHTGERPYTCEICESRFSDSNQLKAHMLIHNGEKPFGCGQCQSKFRRRHHLMSHKCGSIVSDQLSHNSEASDESLDIAKTTSHFQKCHQLLQGLKGASKEPLNLSNEIVPNGNLMNNFMAKFNETKNLMTPRNQIGYIQTDLPVQTEPEDLSMHSPKSPVSMDELEELDDAATLYARLQHKNKILKQTV